ncbi:hypothetical protein PMG11_06604 [Penicillium brasilianum]|uniref:Uncharacterized protein n=1 Tax=Penicillium brasilianum TaxID=104259 RepID=A0A0F7TMH4_PENBI|nr:hypothetical protein PMG11_06604 [Penicillium brasilianum]
MKSPLYVLAVLLPLATQLVAASPTAEFDEFESLEDRQGGSNSCKIRTGFSYRKYPCDSSDIIGRENPGGQWQATCRYKNFYKTKKGWVRSSDKPKACRGSFETTQCPNPSFT